MTKVTKKVALQFAIDAINDYCEDDAVTAEVVGVLGNMIAQLDKRASAPKKPTKKQVANEGVKAEIVTFLSGAKEPMTVKAIAEGMGIEAWQKVSALLTQLKNDGTVVRSEVKGKAYFALANEVEG